MSIMANGAGWPQIVHCPHNRLSRSKNLSQARKRQHTLINPGKVNDISFLKLAKMRHIHTCIGYIYFKQMFPCEVKMPENAPSFPQESPPRTQFLPDTRHGYTAGSLVTHEHFGLYPIIVEGIYQPIGGHCGATGILACIDYQNSHMTTI